MEKNLSRKQIIEQVNELIEPKLSALNYEIVEVDYLKELGDYYLRIFAYSENGIGLEDCEKIARLVSEILDEKDIIPGAYYLEVSSPGLDRPISTDADFKRSINKNIEIKLYKSIDNIKNYEGTLIDYNKENIKLLNKDGVELEIPRELISLAKLVINF